MCILLYFQSQTFNFTNSTLKWKHMFGNIELNLICCNNMQSVLFYSQINAKHVERTTESKTSF